MKLKDYVEALADYLQVIGTPDKKGLEEAVAKLGLTYLPGGTSNGDVAAQLVDLASFLKKEHTAEFHKLRTVLTFPDFLQFERNPTASERGFGGPIMEKLAYAHENVRSRVGAIEFFTQALKDIHAGEVTKDVIDRESNHLRAIAATLHNVELPAPGARHRT